MSIVGRFTGSRARVVASSTTLCLAAGLLISVAVGSPGYSQEHPALNDGGVWVTNAGGGPQSVGPYWGRLDRPAGALNAALSPPTDPQSQQQLDVFQDGSAVVGWDQTAGELYPLDVAAERPVKDGAAQVPASDRVALQGGTLAVFDPKRGLVWAERVDPASGVTSLAAVDTASTTTVLGSVGLTSPASRSSGNTAVSAADMIVGEDGTVHVVSASGASLDIAQQGSGFAAPVGRQQPASVLGTDASLSITAVGSDVVSLSAALDATRVTLPDGETRDVGAGAVLQQAGPAADAVIVATPAALLAIPLSGGPTRVISSVPSSGEVAAPVVVDGYVYGAWPGWYVVAPEGRTGARTPLPDSDRQPGKPVYRVNRDELALNYPADGEVWDVSTDRRVDNWPEVTVPRVASASSPLRRDTPRTSSDDAPKANDDDLRARPGRQTVLHVLDNDTGSAAGVLSIYSINQPGSGAAATISADHQTVVLTLPATARGTVRFSYEIADGTTGSSGGPVLSAAGQVAVHVVAGSGDSAPYQQSNDTTSSRPVSVAAGGELSLPVLTDWRDKEGDPVVVESGSVVSGAGTVAVSAAGSLTFAAPSTPGPVTLTYTVSDGKESKPSRPVRVDVVGPTGAAVAPSPRPDVVSAVAGSPVVVYPLANDLPGVDPTDPAAALELTTVESLDRGLIIATDPATGAVTITAERRGAYQINYSERLGSATPADDGVIGLDVSSPAVPAQTPVTAPDTGWLFRDQTSTTVDVLANDLDPEGGVLTLTGASVGADSPLTATVVDGRWVRVDLTGPLSTPAAGKGAAGAGAIGGQVVTYTVSDGSASAEGQLTVSELPTAASAAAVAVEDAATVRVGDSAALPVLDNDISPSGQPLALVLPPGSTGRLTETGADGSTDPAVVGSAFVSGNDVRYVAPAARGADQVVTVDYYAQVEGQDGAGVLGVARIALTNDPPAAGPDQAPQPVALTSRAVTGETVTIPVPTSGVDPDGDSVALTAITAAPHLGRVVGTTASSITYQAFPGATAPGQDTDELTYRVTDRWGLSGTAKVRIGVVAPTLPAAPVAVADTIAAKPGTVLAVDVTTNDIIPVDQTVAVRVLPGAGAAVPGHPDRIAVTAPADGVAITVPYRLELGSGLAESDSATLTVIGRATAQLPPPTASDVFVPAVAAGATTATTSLAGSISDASQGRAAFSLVALGGRPTTQPLSAVRLPVERQPYAISYVVQDANGQASGVIHVPAAPPPGPQLIAGSELVLPVGGKRSVRLRDLVSDGGGGRTISLTAGITTTAGVTATGAAGGETFEVTAAPGFTGAAAVTLPLTDGTARTGPPARRAEVTIPVFIGTDTSLVTCPADGLPLAIDTSITFALTSVCQVWTAMDSVQAVDFRASAPSTGSGISVASESGGLLTLTAAPTASTTRGAPEAIAISVVGAAPGAGQLLVRVVARPTLLADVLTAPPTAVGQTQTVDASAALRSAPSGNDDASVTVNDVKPSGSTNPDDAAVTFSKTGSLIRLTPHKAAAGRVLTYRVNLATNGPGAPSATTTLTVQVTAPPGAPGAPTLVGSPGSGQAQLSWTPATDYGSPVTQYQLRWSGGEQVTSQTSLLTRGLHDGTPYRFQVRAQNLVGWGPWSAESPAVVTASLPGPVVGLTAAQSGSLSVSPTSTVSLSWTPGTAGAAGPLSYRATANGSPCVVQGDNGASCPDLQNGRAVVFSVVAIGKQGTGVAASTTWTPYGLPYFASGSAPEFGATAASAGGGVAVTVTWPAANSNGGGALTYTVSQSAPGSGSTSQSVQADQATFSQQAGGSYRYVIQASASGGSGAQIEGSYKAGVPGRTPTTAPPSTTPRGPVSVPPPSSAQSAPASPGPRVSSPPSSAPASSNPVVPSSPSVVPSSASASAPVKRPSSSASSSSSKGPIVDPPPNSASASSSASSSSSTGRPNVPPPPTNVSAEADSPDGTVTLRFTVTQSAEMYNVVKGLWRNQNGQEGPISVDYLASGNIAVATSLDLNSGPYEFQIQVMNKYGNSLWSDFTNSAQPYSVPEAPTDPVCTTSTDSMTWQLGWTEGLPNGGANSVTFHVTVPGYGSFYTSDLGYPVPAGSSDAIVLVTEMNDQGATSEELPIACSGVPNDSPSAQPGPSDSAPAEPGPTDSSVTESSPPTDSPGPGPTISGRQRWMAAGFLALGFGAIYVPVEERRRYARRRPSVSADRNSGKK